MWYHLIMGIAFLIYIFNFGVVFWVIYVLGFYMLGKVYYIYINTDTRYLYRCVFSPLLFGQSVYGVYILPIIMRGEENRLYNY
jgi:hypothetical protein